MTTQMVERGTLLKVLDHGYVRLVDFMGKDESIVEAARMSTGKGFISWDAYSRCESCGEVQAGTEPNAQLTSGQKCAKHKMVVYPNGDVGLLDTLWRKKHATPFEMGELVIEVQAPIMVFREWHRHRTQSYNEFSARYSVMPNIHYLPEPSRIQKQNSANKQGSAEAFSPEDSERILKTLQEEQQQVYMGYEDLVDEGVAREIARINTPVSRYSRMRAKGNIRNWFQFLNLRMRPDAQKEIQAFANEVAKLISWLWPKAYSLFEEYDLYGAHFSRTELKVLKEMLEWNLERKIVMPKDTLGLTGTKLKEFIEKLEFGGDKILS